MLSGLEKARAAGNPEGDSGSPIPARRTDSPAERSVPDDMTLRAPSAADATTPAAFRSPLPAPPGESANPLGALALESAVCWFEEACDCKGPATSPSTRDGSDDGETARASLDIERERVSCRWELAAPSVSTEREDTATCAAAEVDGRFADGAVTDAPLGVGRFVPADSREGELPGSD